MSYPPQQPPYYPAPPPAPAPARPRPWLWIGLTALLLAVVGGLAAALLSNGNEPSRAEQAAVALPAPTTTTEAAPATATPTPDGYTPKPSDLKLTPKIVDKECFGSAGCLVNFRVDVTYSGLPLGQGTTWLIVYEINGVEDGPQVGNLELQGEQFTSQEESVETKSSKSKITLTVTSVDKN